MRNYEMWIIVVCICWTKFVFLFAFVTIVYMDDFFAAIGSRIRFFFFFLLILWNPALSASRNLCLENGSIFFVYDEYIFFDIYKIIIYIGI